MLIRVETDGWVALMAVCTAVFGEVVLKSVESGGGYSLARFSWCGSLHVFPRVDMRIVEKITGVDFPRSVSYTVQSGPMPFRDHLGTVQFRPAERAGSTLVLWDIEYTPTTMGTILCCGGSLLSLMIRLSLGKMLSNMSRAAQT